MTRVYNVRSHSVTICDTSVLEDPFWPDHVSTIFTVEQKRRNMFWTTIRIWQVSLLNDGKKIVHQFHRFWPRTDGQPFEYEYVRSDVITCFQSRGVIFILVREIEDHAKDYALLFIYDTRFKKSAVYAMKLLSQEVDDDRPLNLMISITCLGRLVSVNGSVDGWRIRMLSATTERATEYRLRIINEMFQLREDALQIMSEEILIGRFAMPYRVRTSRGHFGVCANYFGQESQSPIIFFNEITSDFVLFRNFNDLMLMDARFIPWPNVHFCFYSDRRLHDRDSWSCPVFTNDREAIRSVTFSYFCRTEFRPSSLQYRAAKSIFHRNPRLRYQLDAEGFRRATGTPGMDGHFG